LVELFYISDLYLVIELIIIQVSVKIHIDVAIANSGVNNETKKDMEVELSMQNANMETVIYLRDILPFFT
jgi:hypothetical protein